jgi:hypothetical protein
MRSLRSGRGSDGGYDTGAMERPAPEEMRRALKALALGALLGVVMRLLSRSGAPR